jgi:hypothetical protein
MFTKSRSDHLGVRGGLGHAPDEAVDALFRQAGIMVTHRRNAMFDIAKIASRQPLPAGERVRVIANSATLAAQLTTSATAAGLLAEHPAVVLPAQSTPATFSAAAEQALADETCDSVLCAAVNVYSEGVRRGGTLVSAKVADAQVSEAEAVLDRNKSVDATTRGAAYRQSGWTSFDADAPAYTTDQVDQERSRYESTAATTADRY